MDTGLNGKVVLVVGGASGIGEACVRAFVSEGSTVVVADIDDTRGHEASERAGAASFVHVDMVEPDGIEAMVAHAVSEYGGLDAAVNSAGTNGRQGTMTADYDLDDWRHVIDVNLTGTFLSVRAEVRAMLARGAGSIVNIASGAGLVGTPGEPAYVASKHGVVGLSKAAALEYARKGIRVNAVCPGPTRTPMIEAFLEANPKREQQILFGQPIGRLGNPDEVAAAVVWLCSDPASFVVGHPFAVDGGAVTW